MDENPAHKPPRTTSIPTLIGWLSLCLLAAAWGRSLDETSQMIWAETGAFGLVTAVGLGALETARAAKNRQARERATQVQLEIGLDRLHQHSATLESIHVAVRRLAERALWWRQDQLSKPTAPKRRQALLLSGYPLEIVSVEDETDNARRAPRIAGVLRQISSRAITFEHAAEFAGKLVLLSFELDNGEQLSFVVEVVWTQKAGDSYASGGTVLAVGSPVPQDEVHPSSVS